MKNAKRWLCLILACVLCLTVAGCNGDGPDSSDVSGEDLAGTTVKLLMWTTPSEFDEQIFENFRQETGINLEVDVAGWDGCWEKLTNGVAAGDPYDVTMMFGSFYPTHVIRGLFQPIDEYWDKDDPMWNAEQMEWYEWNGKTYAFCAYDYASPTFSSAMTGYMYYNKAMLDNAGLEYPLELDKRGEWNWEAFENMLKELTVDTNYDGKIDQWGLSKSGYPYHYVGSNDTSYTVKGEDGKWVLNFDDPALAEVLEFTTRITTQYMGDGKFGEGTAAFQMQGEDGGRVFYDLDFEWDFVNVPYGPNNTEKKTMLIGNGGLGIIAGSKNPEGAAALIRYLLDSENAVENDEFTEEQRQYIVNGKKNLTVSSPAFEGHDIYNLMPNLLNGSKTPAEVLESARQSWTNGILKTYEGTGIVTLAEGKTFQGIDKIDFENGAMDPLRIVGGENTTVSITTDPNEVVSGQYSLVLSTTEKSESFVEIDPTKVNKIEPGNFYNISVSYRILEDFGNNGYGYMNFALVNDYGDKIGEAGEISGSKDESGVATVEVMYIDNFENVRLKFTGEFVGKVAIDDIVITAHK